METIDILMVLGGIVLLLLISFLIYKIVSYKKSKDKGGPQPGPKTGPQPGPLPNIDDNSKLALVASPGTGVIDMIPYISTVPALNTQWWTKYTNNPEKIFKGYEELMNAKNFTVQKCAKDSEQEKLLTYLNAIYYATNVNNMKKLTTDQLTALYRSLVFFYITTGSTQPDGGWYGDYWSNRILDDGPIHTKNTGKTNMTAQKNEVFLFDQAMTTYTPKTCPAYQKKYNKYCPAHSKFFGNRLFAETNQSTLRRGMRNSPQVLAENPPWAKDGKMNPRYGTGGFPKNAYVEMLQFPQEHGAGGWPAGCDATKAQCELVKETFSPPRYQPYPDFRAKGGDPYCGMKPQWFYFAQGLGQFWNLGETSYCYSYIDMFLNAPMGTGKNSSKKGNNVLGWSSGFAPCTDNIEFPPGGGVLGYDVEDPTMPTERDYNNPAYSVKLLLEFASRVDIPGPCKDTTGCSQGLRDPRTGKMGIGYCAAGNNNLCPCDKKSDDDYVNCMNSPESSYSSGGGCGPSQPINSRQDAMNEQIAKLMGLKKGTYWKPYAQQTKEEYQRFDHRNTSGDRHFTYYPEGDWQSQNQYYDLNKAKGEAGTLNQYGGFDPNPAWKDACKKENPVYPKRSEEDFDYDNVDNREIVCGWVNGHFYGYPKEYTLGDKKRTPNPFEGGIAGTDPKTGKIIYGKKFTKEDPLVYYDGTGKELYSTYYGKPLKLDEDTALRLFAEFYSCGDSGFENFEYNWPFGCYFGYGQALGSPGKSLANGLSCFPYSCTTVQFTSTATSYGSVVQPAYDFEVLYIPPINAVENANAADCTCATAVTLDLTADFNSDTPGKDLKLFANINKGSVGGYVAGDSPAGKSAVAFQGQNMKVTNWTTVESKTGTFDPSKKNKVGVDSNPIGICR